MVEGEEPFYVKEVVSKSGPIKFLEFPIDSEKELLSDPIPSSKTSKTFAVVWPASRYFDFILAHCDGKPLPIHI